MKSWSLKVRRQTQDGPIDCNFTIVAEDDAAEVQGSSLLLDMQFQANQHQESIYGVETVPVRVHVFELEDASAS